MCTCVVKWIKEGGGAHLWRRGVRVSLAACRVLTDALVASLAVCAGAAGPAGALPYPACAHETQAAGEQHCMLACLPASPGSLMHTCLQATLPTQGWISH